MLTAFTFILVIHLLKAFSFFLYGKQNVLVSMGVQMLSKQSILLKMF